jgi:hypothetical protein
MGAIYPHAAPAFEDAPSLQAFREQPRRQET